LEEKIDRTKSNNIELAQEIENLNLEVRRGRQRQELTEKITFRDSILEKTMNPMDSFDAGFYNEVNVRDLDEKLHQSQHKEISGRINRSEVNNENVNDVYPDRSPIFNY